MNIIRKIKIEKLGYYKFTESEKELVNFIKDYSNYKFYYKNNNFILYTHIPSKNLYISTNIVNKLYLYSNDIEICNLFTNILNINITNIYTTNDIILNNYEYYKED